MNVLLFAPGVLAVLIKQATPKDLVRGLLGGVVLQAAAAAPFLAVAPQSYIARAFEFSRVFQHVWTVNWKFLPEDWFVSQRFAVWLIIGHLFLLWRFADQRW